MRKIRAIFFDAGNTLLYLDFKHIAEELAAAGTHITPDGLELCEYEARDAVDKYLAKGEVVDEEVWSTYFGTMFRAAGLTDCESISCVIDNLRRREQLTGLWRCAPPLSTETLIRLRSLGYKLGVISNADGRVESVLESTGLLEHLDFVLDSRLVGCEKPDPRIFRMALELAGEPPEACIHVGDIVSADVFGARSVGITPVLLDPTSRHDVDCLRIRSLSDLFNVIESLETE